MTDIEINKRIHEILGSREDIEGMDFLTWQGFGLLWEWLQTDKLRTKFQNCYGGLGILTGWFNPYCAIMKRVISPRALAEAIVELSQEELK